MPLSDWTEKPWFGNPDLGLIAAEKIYVYSRCIPVWIFGYADTHEQWSFCVHAGASSDLSYTGLCINCYTMLESQNYVDKLYQDGRLFI